MGDRKFTKEELSQYNGKDGKPVFITANGKVYDVTTSFLWENGDHQDEHTAGHDLTEELADAPHDDYVFEQFEVVGELVEE